MSEKIGLGKKLQYARELAELSPAQLAGKAKISVAILQALEKEISIDSVPAQTLVLLAEILNVSLEFLVSDGLEKEKALNNRLDKDSEFLSPKTVTILRALILGSGEVELRQKEIERRQAQIITLKAEIGRRKKDIKILKKKRIQ